MSVPRCPNRARHWFTVYGQVGLRRPDCSSCGFPNPHFTEEQRHEYEAFVEYIRARRAGEQTT